MQQRVWLAFAIVAGISFAVQVSWPVDLTDRPETTFDTAPRGHAGLLALLDHFDATRGRWMSGLTMPPPDSTVWWIAPRGVCDDRRGALASKASKDGIERDTRSESDTEGEKKTQAERTDDRTIFEIAVRPWIEAGGTAVVWLAHPPLDEPEGVDPATREDRDGIRAGIERTWRADGAGGKDASGPEAIREDWKDELARRRERLREGEPGKCDGIAGFPLPPRRLAGLEGGRPPVESAIARIVFSVGRAVERREDFDYAGTRILPGPTLAFFDVEPMAERLQERPREGSEALSTGPSDSPADPSGDDTTGWRPLWVGSDDFAPLALARPVGSGRLVVFADARILSNGRLAHVDSAPFVFDQVRDHGEPYLDEHFHGVVPEPGWFRYLARSPAWAAGLGMIVVGLLVIGRGHAWPQRDVADFDSEAPTLSDFVDSVARLYSETGDHERVFERYRALSLDRIRRALGLAPGTPIEIVLSSLRRRAPNWPELEETGLRHLLARRVPIRSASDLERNVARLDELVHLVKQGRSGRGRVPGIPGREGHGAGKGSALSGDEAVRAGRAGAKGIG
ncbi:MAG TPA: hypothetical protein ENI85_00135 [Deltaproteobacteria bacterium]|nr:hypothetical protein [Deltaproteobacteria bacterium]